MLIKMSPIKKIWYKHTMFFNTIRFHLAINPKEIKKHANKWIELEKRIFIEEPRIKRQLLHVISHIWFPAFNFYIFVFMAWGV